MTTRPRLLLLCILILSLWLRWPTLSEGKPFFYDEDEAHHFNRIVNMVKNQTLNPEYFHKPSLHFYLRMPAVILGYLIDQSNDETPSLQHIRTTDRYGLARYSFSWSHPRVVMAVRAVSLLLTLCSCLLVYIVGRQLSLPDTSALAACAIFSVSPELFHYSSFIGVDVPLLFFAILSTSLALAFQSHVTTGRVWILGVVSGLAVSCKYNGLPIALLPLLLVIESGQLRSPRLLFGALLAPAIGFFIGSPYILVSFPLFYKQLSYEAWHYAVAGHEGHSAEPGLAQALHYGRWLASDGLGAASSLLALAGIALLLRRTFRPALTFLLFPILFFALMSAQRANFVRNMLPVLPYVAVLAAAALTSFRERLPGLKLIGGCMLPLLTLLAILAPLSTTLTLRHEALAATDSRLILEDWLTQHHETDIAVTGDLQPQRAIRALSGVSIVAPTASPEELYQDGIDLLITRGTNPRPIADSSLTEVKDELQIPGSLSDVRVLKNPAISIYRLAPVPEPGADSSHVNSQSITVNQALAGEGEPHLWITARVTRLELKGLPAGERPVKLQFLLMSPWKNQRIELLAGNWRQQILLNPQNPGEWETIELEVPRNTLINNQQVIMRLGMVSSPEVRHLSQDSRRLGIALQRVTALAAE